MSESISFLYPITRVGSLYQLLCTTTHSAFPVVTPLISLAKPLQNVSNKHTPVLYRNDFTLTRPHGAMEKLATNEVVSPKKIGRHKRTTFSNHLIYNKHSIRETVDSCSAQLLDGDGIEYSYQIPSSQSESREAFQTKNMREGTPFVLHGMILRTQLIQMLKNRVFFSDNEQASC